MQAKKCKDCEKNAAPRKVRCSSCDYRHEKQVRPYETAFRQWRNSVAARQAKAPESRKHEYKFEITLEQFKEFARPVDLLDKRGRYATSLHIDRKENEKGYVIDNLQPLENSDNVRKENERRAKRKAYDWELAERRRLGQYASEDEAKADEGKSVFYYAVSGESPNFPKAPY